MKKDEITARYGKAEYKRRLESNRQWLEANPEKVIAKSREQSRKGGRQYVKMLKYQQIGLQGERKKVRRNHARDFKPFKDSLALEAHVHHEWIPGSAEYTGVALVDANLHRHGIINVLQILDGDISIFTEEELPRTLRSPSDNFQLLRTDENYKKGGRRRWY